MCPSPVSVFSPSCPRILTFFMCNVHVSLSRSVCAILFWWHPVSCVLNVVLLPLSSYLIKMSAVLPPVGCSPYYPLCICSLSLPLTHCHVLPHCCVLPCCVFSLLIQSSVFLVFGSRYFVLCTFQFTPPVSESCFWVHLCQPHSLDSCCSTYI